MNNQELTEYIEYLLSIARTKCKEPQDAEDIVQETVLAALTYLSKGGKIDRYKPWLVSVMNRKFYDKLRAKYQLSTVTVSDGFDIVDHQDCVDELIRQQEEEHIRQQVAYLSHIYREVVVQYYFYGKDVQQIAKELSIPAGTVKSRLNFGRKQLKEGMEEMKNYAPNSYIPQRLSVRFSGSLGMNEEPLSFTEGDLLSQNLLILAYEKPLTITELSKAIGVASAYVEPVVKKLVDGELMKRMGDGRVYTDFIIYHAEDWVKYVKDQEAFAEQYAPHYFGALQSAIKELKSTDFYSRRLERFMMIEIAQNGLYLGMERLRKPQIFPHRPNGGRWIAFGTIWPENYFVPKDHQGKETYVLSGRRTTYIDRYLNGVALKLHTFESFLDAYQPMHSSETNPLTNDWNFFFSDGEKNLLKLYYLLKNNIAPETVDLDTKILKAIPYLCRHGYLSEQTDTPTVLIPCLTHKQEQAFFNICNQAAKAFGDRIQEPLARYCRTHKMTLPAHLKSVPEQKITMPYEPSPMMFVYEAVNHGIHPRDLGYPCPETFAVFDI